MNVIILEDPFPIDTIGPALRDLDCAVEVLQLTDPCRLYGDRAMIDGAILALMLVRKRIDDLSVRQVAAE
jgi:hypothetical protein